MDCSMNNVIAYYQEQMTAAKIQALRKKISADAEAAAAGMLNQMVAEAAAEYASYYNSMMGYTLNFESHINDIMECKIRGICEKRGISGFDPSEQQIAMQQNQADIINKICRNARLIGMQELYYNSMMAVR